MGTQRGSEHKIISRSKRADSIDRTALTQDVLQCQTKRLNILVLERPERSQDEPLFDGGATGLIRDAFGSPVSATRSARGETQHPRR